MKILILLIVIFSLSFCTEYKEGLDEGEEFISSIRVIEESDKFMPNYKIFELYDKRYLVMYDTYDGGSVDIICLED